MKSIMVTALASTALQHGRYNAHNTRCAATVELHAADVQSGGCTHLDPPSIASGSISAREKYLAAMQEADQGKPLDQSKPLHRYQLQLPAPDLSIAGEAGSYRHTAPRGLLFTPVRVSSSCGQDVDLSTDLENSKLDDLATDLDSLCAQQELPAFRRSRVQDSQHNASAGVRLRLSELESDSETAGKQPHRQLLSGAGARTSAKFAASQDVATYELLRSNPPPPNTETTLQKPVSGMAPGLNGRSGCFDNLPHSSIAAKSMSDLAVDVSEASGAATFSPSRSTSVNLESSQRIESFQVTKRSQHNIIGRYKVAMLPFAGQDEAKQALFRTLAAELLYPAGFFRGIRTVPSNLLLCGPPGTGKTSILQAAAAACQFAVFAPTTADILSKYTGQTEQNLQEVFRKAKTIAGNPANRGCILFLDELDALVPSRDRADDQHGIRLVCQLLVELDMLEPAATVQCCQSASGALDLTSTAASQSRMENELYSRHVHSDDMATVSRTQPPTVKVIGATNRPKAIDAAVLRRMKAVHFGLPSPAAVCELVRQALTSDQLEHTLTEADITRAAQALDGLSPSNILSILREACWQPVAEQLSELWNTGDDKNGGQTCTEAADKNDSFQLQVPRVRPVTVQDVLQLCTNSKQ